MWEWAISSKQMKGWLTRTQIWSYSVSMVCLDFRRVIFQCRRMQSLLNFCIQTWYWKLEETESLNTIDCKQSVFFKNPWKWMQNKLAQASVTVDVTCEWQSRKPLPKPALQVAHSTDAGMSCSHTYIVLVLRKSDITVVLAQPMRLWVCPPLDWKNCMSDTRKHWIYSHDSTHLSKLLHFSSMDTFLVLKVFQ